MVLSDYVNFIIIGEFLSLVRKCNGKYLTVSGGGVAVVEGKRPCQSMFSTFATIFA